MSEKFVDDHAVAIIVLSIVLSIVLWSSAPDWLRCLFGAC